jgi:hypothetical protein
VPLSKCCTLECEFFDAVDNLPVPSSDTCSNQRALRVPLRSSGPNYPCCLPETTVVYTENLIRVDGGGNRLTSAHNDRAVVFYPGRRGLAVKVEEPA